MMVSGAQPNSTSDSEGRRPLLLDKIVEASRAADAVS